MVRLRGKKQAEEETKKDEEVVSKELPDLPEAKKEGDGKVAFISEQGYVIQMLDLIYSKMDVLNNRQIDLDNWIKENLEQ